MAVKKCLKRMRIAAKVLVQQKFVVGFGQEKTPPYSSRLETVYGRGSEVVTEWYLIGTINMIWPVTTGAERSYTVWMANLPCERVPLRGSFAKN